MLVLHLSRWEVSHLEAAFRVLCQQSEGAVVGMCAASRILLALALAARVNVFRRNWWVVQQTHRRRIVAVALEHTGVT